MNKYFFFIACLLIIFNINAQNDDFDVMLDSIQRLRKLSKEKDLDINVRLLYAKRASKLSYETGIDSTILISNNKLRNIYLNMNNHVMLKDMAYKNLKLAHKLNDSIEIAHSNLDLAWYYILKEIHNDSGYYYSNRALKLYSKLKNLKGQSFALSYIADMQTRERDFIHSEENLIKAISFLQVLPENNENLSLLFSYYNTIGLNTKYLKLYDKSIEYYKKALTFNDKLSEDYSIEGDNNMDKFKNYLYAKINLAGVYKEKKDYQKALSIYKKLLENKEILKKDPLSYAAIINNKSYNLFLSKNGNTKYINSLFNKAYKISDSLNASYEITAIGNDMAEFYQAINKKDSALILSKRSYEIGKDIKNYFEVSRALLMLSKIVEGEAGKRYLYEHIKLNDSLLDLERASRNKFARIQYETDTYIEETKRLTTQNILIIVIGLIVVLIFILILIIRIQITKNKILSFESEQQKANEEIYTLMLRQQAKVEEGRLLERHHISEELHDGILNRLLGSRLGLEFLSMDEKDQTKENYSFYINEIQSIEREIRDLSHELKNTQLDPDKDFITILDGYVGKQNNLHSFQYSISQKSKIFWEDINDYLKVNLYRIIQEAIQNVIKHAKANKITINFALNSNNLYVDIRDNGIGFNINQKGNGIGLLNIKSRVSKLKGKYKITSEIKKGTTLILIIPLS